MMIVMVVEMTIHDDDDGEDDNADNHHDHDYDHNDILVQELPLEMAARSKEAARLTKVSPIIF